MLKLIKKYFSKNMNKLFEYNNKDNSSIKKLLILSHRLDKALVNEKINEKYEVYYQELLETINDLKSNKKLSDLVQWAEMVIKSYKKHEKLLILNNKTYKENDVKNICLNRFSCRLWKKKQNLDNLYNLALESINIAIQSPTSSNRQPWRFLILRNEELYIFNKLKEKHVINAPIGIFIGMDLRSYQFDNRKDYSIEQIYLDAGAEIMSMIIYLESKGLNTCWNHLGKDLIVSRPINSRIYRQFALKYKIGDYIEPIAVLVFGEGNNEVNLKPPRMNLDFYMIGEK